MTTIDRYIRRATVGLPRRERLDTAAELRVHLNERLRALSAEGFAREEAEHLVVERMGPVDEVNRRLLNHAFTARAGWTVAAILLLGVVAWLAIHYLFAPPLLARPHALTLSDVLPLIGDLAAVDVTVPTTARTSVLGVTQGGATVFTVAGPALLADTVPERANQRIKRTLVAGFPAASVGAAACAPGTRPFAVRTPRGGDSATCLVVPSGSVGGRWHQLAAGGLPVRFDVWQPVLAFEPIYPPALPDGTAPDSVPSTATGATPGTTPSTTPGTTPSTTYSATLTTTSGATLATTSDATTDATLTTTPDATRDATPTTTPNTARDTVTVTSAGTDPGTAGLEDGSGDAAGLDSVRTSATSDRTDWIVLSIYTSRAPLAELGAMPSPPTGAALKGTGLRQQPSGSR